MEITGLIRPNGRHDFRALSRHPRRSFSASATRSASSTTASGPSRPTRNGLDATCFSTTSSIRRCWAREHVETFLSHLAVEANVAAATQNQAKAALLFLYREVLKIELPWLDNVARAKTPTRLPTVLTRQEVGAVLHHLQGTHALIGGLLYGAGLRIMEGVRLRVQDVDTRRRQLLIRNGKGFKDRITMMPDRLTVDLARQLADGEAPPRARLGAGSRRGVAALRAGAQVVAMRAASGAGSTSSRPIAGRPIRGRGIVRRHHVSDQSFQRAMRQAVRDAQHRQARDAAHAAPFVRDAPAGVGLRHPHGAGAAGARRRSHHDDLHARAEPRRPRRAQPARRDRRYRGRSSW